MVSLKNKYLVNNLGVNFSEFEFLLVSHYHYLTTAEVNLLRQHCKANGITCVNPKNKVARQFLSQKDKSLSNLLTSRNLMFFSNSFEAIANLFEAIKSEKSRLVPLAFFGYNRLVVLSDSCLIFSKSKEKSLLDLLSLLNLLVARPIIFSSEFNFLYHFYLNNANANATCKKC